MENKKDVSLLDVLFSEKIFVYSLPAILITFTFFSILTEIVKIYSSYYSPFFYWYPVYFVIILLWSTYTNFSMSTGNRFLRSIIESVSELIILLVLNFVLLKGLRFESVAKLLDLDMGISFFMWIVLRILHGHMIRLVRFPYYLLTVVANAKTENLNLSEVFEKEFFADKENSVITIRRRFLATVSFMTLVLVIAVVITNSHSILTSIYSALYIFSVVFLYMNINKAYIIQESTQKEGEFPIEIMPNWGKNTVKIAIVTILISGIIAIGVYYGIYELSNKLNFSLKNIVNTLLNQSSKKEEEERKIQEIRKKLLSQETQTNNYVYQKPKEDNKSIPIIEILFVISGIIFASGIIGLVMKEILKYNKQMNALTRFFIGVYETFLAIFKSIYISIKNLLYWLYRALTFRRRQPLEFEEELMKSMIYGREDEISQEKYEEIETIVKLFIKMLHTTSYFVPYRKSMGIQEYCEKLKSYLAEFSKEIDFISEVVNESRYSLHVLDLGIIDELRNKIDEVISKISVKVKVVEDFRGY